MFKNERLRDAVHRVANEELNIDVTIQGKIGSYEHLYESADVDGTETKYYLVTTFMVIPKSDKFKSDDQHSELKVFSSPFTDFYTYIEQCLDEIDLLDREPAVEKDYR